MKALTKRKTDYDECDRDRSRKQSLVQPRQESGKETMPPVISVVVHGTSVAYSYSPSLQSYQDSLPIFPSHRPVTSTQVSPYSYHRATIGLLDIRDMLYFLKLRGVCTTWPRCSAIPGVSVGQTNGRSALFGKGGNGVEICRGPTAEASPWDLHTTKASKSTALSSTSAQEGSRSALIHSPQSLRP